MIDQPMRLWEGKAPNQQGDSPADIPTITRVRPDKNADGSAIIVCPGGAYMRLGDHEGVPVAQRLNETGITGFVLRYRYKPYRHPTPLLDVARAIRTVRARAKEWELDPTRIGVLGFSAGGHLSATVSTKFDDGDPKAADPIDRVSSRPDVAVLCYPVITFSEPSAYMPGGKNLLGDDATKEQFALLSAERHVSPRTPPTFLWHTVDDDLVDVENSFLYATALRKHKVPFALHIYESGLHGLGLMDDHPVDRTWSRLCADWLASHRFGWADKSATTTPATRRS
jgi:acetyl esterase/lipase